MAETVLDQLVVELTADSAPLRESLENMKSDVGLLDTVTQKAAQSMKDAFEDFATTGKFSFESLKSTAISALASIASAALESGINSIFGSSSVEGGSLLSGVTSVISGLFGRATGGTVAASTPYMIGERGPELFIPQSAGRIMGHDQLGGSGASSSSSKTTNITINLSGGTGSDMENRKSASQIAVAVRQAVSRADRNL